MVISLQSELPEGWKLIKIGDACEVIGGGTPSREKIEYYNGNIIWLTPTEISKTHIVTINNSREKISELGLQKSSAKKIPAGAVLLTSRATIGNIAIAGKEVTTNQGFSSFICPDYINNKYLAYWLKFIKKLLNEKAKGTTFKEISKTEIRSLLFPLPPVSVQQQIVFKIEELYSELDNSIEQLKTAKQQLKVYRRSVLKWAFEGKLTEDWREQQEILINAEEVLRNITSERKEIAHENKIKLKPIPAISEEEFSKLPKLPKQMCWVRLGDLLWSVKDGPHYSPKYESSGIPFISGGNIRPQGIDFSNTKFISQELHIELSKRCKPEKGDILYTKGGTTGIARVNTYDVDFNVWVHVAVLKPVKYINPFYLQHALNSLHCYRQSQKYTHGVGNQDLGLTRMVLITLPICSLEEQNQIVQEIESRLSVADKVEETIVNSLDQAEALRQSILKKAFEGKLAYKFIPFS